MPAPTVPAIYDIDVAIPCRPSSRDAQVRKGTGLGSNTTTKSW
jgi:hypothetical protein